MRMIHCMLDVTLHILKRSPSKRRDCSGWNNKVNLLHRFPLSFSIPIDNIFLPALFRHILFTHPVSASTQGKRWWIVSGFEFSVRSEGGVPWYNFCYHDFQMLWLPRWNLRESVSISFIHLISTSNFSASKGDEEAPAHEGTPMLPSHPTAPIATPRTWWEYIHTSEGTCWTVFAGFASIFTVIGAIYTFYEPEQ